MNLSTSGIISALWHEDHIAGKGCTSMTHYDFLHRSLFPCVQATEKFWTDKCNIRDSTGFTRPQITKTKRQSRARGGFATDDSEGLRSFHWTGLVWRAKWLLQKWWMLLQDSDRGGQAAHAVSAYTPSKNWGRCQSCSKFQVWMS